MIEKIKILVIGGPSGCGKTYLKDKLCNEYTGIYSSPIQVTTRNMREGETQGDPYDFIDKNVFDSLVNTNQLIGLNINFNGNDYGTRINSLSNTKINILILSKEVIESLIEFNENHHLFEIKIITIDMEYSDVPELSKRKDRTQEFYEKEREIFKLGNLCYRIKNYDEIYYEKVNLDIMKLCGIPLK